jgi:hypothetical protein
MSLPTSPLTAAKPNRKLTLRSLLILPFVLQISATVGLVSYLSFRSGQQAVSEMADRLETEIANRVEKETVGFLETPNSVNQILRSTANSGKLNLVDTPALEKLPFLIKSKRTALSRTYSTQTPKVISLVFKS